MATRKDLIKAHTFTADRLVAALVDRDPDRLDSPLRRVGMAFFASVMVGVVIVAGFGVVGFIQQGGNAKAWQDAESAVVIDSQAGQVFWYTNKQLHPMENIASARLAAGGGAESYSLKTNSLRGVARSTPLGIVDAPRTLPATEDLKLYPIRVCAAAGADDTDDRTITMEFGRSVPDAEVTPVVLTDAQGRYFLVVDGIAHLLPTTAGARPALLLQIPYPQVDGAEALLDSLPVGSELSSRQLLREVPDLGQQSQNGSGAAELIGTLVRVGDGSAHFILLRDGFARLAPLEFEALRAERNLTPVDLAATEVQPRESRQQITANDLPSAMPEIPTDPNLAAQSFCATFADADAPPVISAGAPTPEVGPNVRRGGAGQADLVTTEPGHGAIVRSAAAMSEPESATLITEGLQYGIPGQVELEALGYAGVTKERIRPELLRLIPPGLPDGQTLATDAARRPPQEN